MNVRFGRVIGPVSALTTWLQNDRPAYDITNPGFARAYLITMRPYLFFVSGITGLLGLALGPALAAWPAVLLGLAFFVSYGFGQALTDCFQTDTDALSAPYRPLARGLIRRRDVMTVSLAGLLGVGVVLVASHPLNLPLVALAVAGLATYTWFKRRWWGGPFYNAWIVAVLVLMGHVGAVGAAGGSLHWPPAMTTALLATFFGYANFVLAGYFKDIAADRATGYNTFPVVFGRKATVIVSDLFAVAAVSFTFLTLAMGGLLRRALTDPAILGFLILGTGLSLTAQMRLHRVTCDSKAHRAIAPVVHAYILMLGALVMAFEEGWTLPVLAFYASFIAILRLRPMKAQI
jgi:4-hydroxybenzoate polyprenyltransferase